MDRQPAPLSRGRAPHGAAWRCTYPGGHIIDVSGVDEECLQGALRHTGVLLSEPLAARPSAAHIRVDDTLRDQPLCFALESLQPNETLLCNSDQTPVAWCHDGVATLWPGRDGVSVRLCAGRPLSLYGAFGVAHTFLLGRAGVLLTHAGAFRLNDLCPIVVADSGAGKSTLCAAVVAAGGTIVSDDAVMTLGGQRAAPSVCAHRADAYLHRDAYALLPAAVKRRLGRVVARRDGKLPVRRSDVPDVFESVATATHLVLLEVPNGKRTTTVRHTHQAEALAALIAATPQLAQTGFSRSYAASKTAVELVNRLPAFKISVSADLMSDPVPTLAEIMSALEKPVGHAPKLSA